MMSGITFDLDSFQRNKRRRRLEEFEQSQARNKKRKFFHEMFWTPLFFLGAFFPGGKYLRLLLFRLAGKAHGALRVVATLGRFAKPYHQMLLSGLSSENRRERCAAAYALARLGNNCGALCDDVLRICSKKQHASNWPLLTTRSEFAAHVGIFLEGQLFQRPRQYRLLLENPYPELRMVAAKLMFHFGLSKDKERSSVLSLFRDQESQVRDEMVRSIYRYRRVSGEYIPEMLGLLKNEVLQATEEISPLQDPLVESGGRLLLIVLLRMGSSLYPHLPSFVAILLDNTQAHSHWNSPLITIENGIALLNLPYVETIGAALLAEIIATKRFAVSLLEAIGGIFEKGEKRYQLFALFVLSTLLESNSVQEHHFTRAHQEACLRIFGEIELSYFSYEEDLLIWHREKLLALMKEKGLR